MQTDSVALQQLNVSITAAGRFTPLISMPPGGLKSLLVLV